MLLTNLGIALMAILLVTFNVMLMHVFYPVYFKPVVLEAQRRYRLYQLLNHIDNKASLNRKIFGV